MPRAVHQIRQRIALLILSIEIALEPFAFQVFFNHIEMFIRRAICQLIYDIFFEKIFGQFGIGIWCGRTIQIL